MMLDRIDMHTHTLASGHAYNTIFEMADAAKEQKLDILGISEHAPDMPGTCHRYYFENLKCMPRMIRGQRVLFGAELNILNRYGELDLPQDVLEQLDYCIASIHMPCFHDDKTIENLQQAYEAAFENPCIQIIGHPDDGRFKVDYEWFVKRAGETRTLIELNQGSLNPEGFRPGTWENSRTILKHCKEMGVQVILGSDAHNAFAVKEHTYGMQLLEELDFPEELVVNTDTNRFLSYLRPEVVERRNLRDAL